MAMNNPPMPARTADAALPSDRARVGAEGLLLVGHGSRSQRSEAEMLTIGGRVAARLAPVTVEVGFLEMTSPSADTVLDRLVVAGCRRIVVLPLVLLSAGHAKSDVPALVVEGRARHPGIDLCFGGSLGVARDLVVLLGQAVADAGGQGLPLLVIARGTSDPDANGDAHKAARLIAEWTGAPFVHTAFTGVTGPSVSEALDVFARLGHPRVAVAFWFLCHGRLVDRARNEMATVASRAGIEVVDAGYLGPDERVVALVEQRYGEALGGITAQNCDACAYRAPWPGLEGRVGQAVGVGHSHLAGEHRHRHGEPRGAPG